MDIFDIDMNIGIWVQNFPDHDNGHRDMIIVSFLIYSSQVL